MHKGKSFHYTARVEVRSEVEPKDYEGIDLGGEAEGLITYMRTDGVQIVPEAISTIRKLVTKRYGDRMFAGDDAARRFVKNLAYVGTITTHYRTQHENFVKPTAWPFACTAGETIAVIDYNGDVRACELRQKFASLKDYDYDFGDLWSAQERDAELKAIDGGKACWCTHVCFIHDSMRHSRRALLFEGPRNYLTRESW